LWFILLIVMPGLDPGIHIEQLRSSPFGMDRRVEPGDDRLGQQNHAGEPQR
jgi:hypothetical protein